MKRLFLMRHAKAEQWGPAGDKSRPLNDRGRRDSREQGARLREAGIDLALVSSAVRTTQTFTELGLDCRVEYMDALYDTDVETMRQRIGEIEDDVTGLLVVGHAPTIPALAAELLSVTQPRAADDLQCHYPTATVTAFEVEGPWDELGQHTVTLID
ncbi:SixA phosphatase family protein [Aestuariimicrobium sp. Y1814]|uniref:SixA phosphatase family protein n=1 Tax=Aestuariimicrobium sp. Y1814 TaxID=3418742 RepID=UPI003DA709C8